MGTTIITKDTSIPNTQDIEIFLRFEESQGRIRYNRNSPEMIKKGIKRWIKKELKIWRPL